MKIAKIRPFIKINNEVFNLDVKFYNLLSILSYM